VSCPHRSYFTGIAHSSNIEPNYDATPPGSGLHAWLSDFALDVKLNILKQAAVIASAHHYSGSLSTIQSIFLLYRPDLIHPQGNHRSSGSARHNRTVIERHSLSGKGIEGKEIAKWKMRDTKERKREREREGERERDAFGLCLYVWAHHSKTRSSDSKLCLKHTNPRSGVIWNSPYFVFNDMNVTTEKN
jgi:hypothetical protein